MTGHAEQVAEADRLDLSQKPFDFASSTRVVFGQGTLERLGELASLFTGSRVLVVSDEHITKVGHVDRAVQCLARAGMRVSVFDQVEENPSTKDVARCVDAAKAHQTEIIVGLGGGSSMDCAKGCNFILSNGGRMQDYWGVGKAKLPMLPMIAIPTTSGTGSEAQSFALISDPQTHQKMACGDKKAACRIALLDPDLTGTMPRSVAAATGVDAVSHAIESFVTTKRTLHSRMFAREAWRLLESSFEAFLAHPEEIGPRSNMLLGANLAGSAIEGSMLGGTHACANPLTAHYGIVHGVAIGIMLPLVIRHNAKAAGSDYLELVQCFDPAARAEDPAEQLASRVEQLVENAGQPLKLSEFSVEPGMLPLLASEASKQWTGKFNPCPLDEVDFLSIYRSAL